MARSIEAATVETIYAAAVEPARWTDALQLLTRLCAADSAAINVQHVSAGSGTRIVVGYERARQPRYFDGFAALNPLFKALLSQQYGVPHPHQALVDDAAFKHGLYFNEYCRPNGLHFMAGLVIARTDDTAEWLTINRAQRGGPFEGSQLNGLARLVPHLRRASETSRRLADAHAARTAWEAVLDALGHAVVLLDQRQRVVFANQAARILDAARDGFSLRTERVSAPAVADTLARLIDYAADGDSSGVRSGGHLALPRCSEPLPLSAMVIPLPREGNWQLAAAPAVLLLITDPTRTPIPDATLLMGLFGLTEREAELSALLAGGHTLDAAAGELGIGRETVRTHLSRALAKTGSARQADLVRLTLAATPPVSGMRMRRSSKRS
jgi:DNA-binding CsgD family transcriptional regulator/PAS domain-containing protein